MKNTFVHLFVLSIVCNILESDITAMCASLLCILVDHPYSLLHIGELYMEEMRISSQTF